MSKLIQKTSSRSPSQQQTTDPRTSQKTTPHPANYFTQHILLQLSETMRFINILVLAGLTTALPNTQTPRNEDTAITAGTGKEGDACGTTPQCETGLFCVPVHPIQCAMFPQWCTRTCRKV